MSYLLIGNISALICEDCTEPLAHARIRIYLPGEEYSTGELERGIFKDLRQLSKRDVDAKTDRLLVESVLDEHGNFSISWEGLHLFTEPLEIDICLNSVSGRHGRQSGWAQYHLSTFVPHWKRSKDKHIGAFAYVVPSEKWNAIRGDFSEWVITGAVKDIESLQGMAALRIEAYNAWNDRLLGWADTSESGRYKIYFSGKDVCGGKLQYLIREGSIRNIGPDVYFRIFAGNRMIWGEDRDIAKQPERRQLAPCSKLNVFVTPQFAGKRQPRLNGWLNDLIHISRSQTHYKDRYVM